MICGILDSEDNLRLLLGRGNTTDIRGLRGGFGLIGSVWVLSLESNNKLRNVSMVETSFSI